MERMESRHRTTRRRGCTTNDYNIELTRKTGTYSCGSPDVEGSPPGDRRSLSRLNFANQRNGPDGDESKIACGFREREREINLVFMRQPDQRRHSYGG